MKSIKVEAMKLDRNFEKHIPFVSNNCITVWYVTTYYTWCMTEITQVKCLQIFKRSKSTRYVICTDEWQLLKIVW